MPHIVGFPPLAAEDARLLILGSMPSRESLRQQRYYAHPRNAFWPILCSLLDIRDEDYAARTRAVVHRKVAVWDVLKACFREGSLDAAIDDRSIVVNDFAAFFAQHEAVERVFFNGAKAEAVYRRHVLPELDARTAAIPLQRLPSTSPAHAGMSLDQKTLAWRAILVGGADERMERTRT